MLADVTLSDFRHIAALNTLRVQHAGDRRHQLSRLLSRLRPTLQWTNGLVDRGGVGVGGDRRLD